MVAGEYAVLARDGLAIALAVGRLVQWSVQAAPSVGHLAVTAFGGTNHIGLNRAPAVPPVGLMRFAHEGLRQAQASWQGDLCVAIDLTVFGDQDGRKLGLGTSAAVTVAAIAAWLAAVGAVATDAEVAAVARSAHFSAQDGAGSGYDVSTIAHRGAVVYARSPDRARSVQWPADLAAVALFTGQPAPTVDALARLDAMAATLPAVRSAAQQVVAAWPGGGPELLTALAACDGALRTGNPVADAIFTPAIAVTQAFLADHGLVPRVSGAGGGDCVLGFGSPDQVAIAAQDWLRSGGLVVACLPADLAPPSGTQWTGADHDI